MRWMISTVTFVFPYVCYRSASTTPSGSPCSSQQSVYQPGEGGAQTAPSVPTGSWNPFGDDNFSKLSAEELLNKDFAKLAESKTTKSSLCIDTYRCNG